MAQGSAFPVKWQVRSPFVKLSRAGWTPEGPRVCIQLVSRPPLPPLLSAQSMNRPLTLVWPHCYTVESPMSLSSSALLRSVHSAPLLRASASTLPGNVGTRQHSSKRQKTADAWKKIKKPMPLRVEHKRRVGAGERLAAGPSERSCPSSCFQSYHLHSTSDLPFVCSLNYA